MSGAYSDAAIERHSRHNGRDRSLLGELVYGVTKWKLSLDSIIFKYSNIKRERVAIQVLCILRLGVYQIVFLDKVPVSAACDECVKLAKLFCNKGAVGFVNAILRKISTRAELRHGSAGSLTGAAVLPEDANPSDRMSVLYSYPKWISDRWINRYGEEFAGALMNAGNLKPDLTIRVNRLLTTPDELAERLSSQGYGVRPGRYVGDALIIDNPGDFSATAEFQEGLFTVQDEGAMLCSLALAHSIPIPDTSMARGVTHSDIRGFPRVAILDMCAAPGGKSGHLAEIYAGRADIIAADIHASRLKRMEQNFKRLRHNEIRIAHMDATVTNKALFGTMDCVLLDAPCTGLGVIRRKPEIKWSKSERDLLSITEIQAEMIRNAAMYVRSGGHLVYSVCSTEPEEGEYIVKSFLDSVEAGSSGFEPDISLPAYLPEAIAKSVNAADGSLRLFPHIHGTDGFYLSRLIRRTI